MKIIIVVMCLLICGCSNKISDIISEAPNDKEMNVKEEIEDYQHFSLSYGVGNSNLKYELEKYFKYVPSTIKIVITEEKKEIGFIYEYCISELVEEELLNLKKDRFGNLFVYYGELTKISDEDVYDFGVYESKGFFIQSWKEQERQVSDEVDFYVILDHEKLYISFSEEYAKTVQSLEDENYVSINFSSLFR